MKSKNSRSPQKSSKLNAKLKSTSPRSKKNQGKGNFSDEMLHTFRPIRFEDYQKDLYGGIDWKRSNEAEQTGENANSAEFLALHRHDQPIDLQSKEPKLPKNPHPDNGKLDEFSLPEDWHSGNTLILLEKYIPVESEFQDDIARLTEGERSFVHAVTKALLVERENLRLEFSQLAYQVSDISYSGRLSEWFTRAAELAEAPPARAPRAWDKESGEPPAAAISNIFGYWLEQGRMHQGVLRSLSEELYVAYYSRKRSPRSMGEEELRSQNDVEGKLPTKKEFNDMRLSRELPHSPLERQELQLVKRARQRRAILNKSIDTP